MVNRDLFHSPVQSYKTNQSLSIEQMYLGQKVKIIGYKTVYEEKAEEQDGKPEKCSTGNRHLYLNHTGYLDTYDGKPGIPDMIILKDEAVLLNNFMVVSI